MFSKIYINKHTVKQTNKKPWNSNVQYWKKLLLWDGMLTLLYSTQVSRVNWDLGARIGLSFFLSCFSWLITNCLLSKINWPIWSSSLLLTGLFGGLSLSDVTPGHVLIMTYDEVEEWYSAECHNCCLTLDSVETSGKLRGAARGIQRLQLLWM